MQRPQALNGVTIRTVDTPRLAQNVYFSGDEKGTPVLFLHGNFSSALYWEETMLALPKAYWGIAPDLRGYGWTEDKVIDATRGMRDWSEDLIALLDVLNVKKAHLVGWSMGGGIIYRMLIDHAARFLSVTLISPVSPYGFGGTKGREGAPCHADFAGSGGGVVNREFVSLIQAGERGLENPNSPLNVINSFYYKPPFRAGREEDFLIGALAEKTGSERYPGDSAASENWPHLAPGVWGPVNCWSPKYLGGEVESLIAVTQKPPILWVRGDADAIVSDHSMFDLGTLGCLGYIPGWPGHEIYPPQPMVTQTRSVFEAYAANGGEFSEYVIADTAHSPHIEKPQAFSELFHPFLEKYN
ncbi:MAG: alpha/beta hydrolase [Anaerolineaceae bacterium]|nr:alpha/beta hydrolase [Anaerolineaceae bacterium]